MRKLLIILSIVFAIIYIFTPTGAVGYASMDLLAGRKISITEAYLIGYFLANLPITIAGFCIMLVLAADPFNNKGKESIFVTLIFLGFFTQAFPVLITCFLDGLGGMGCSFIKYTSFGIYLFWLILVLLVFSKKDTENESGKDFLKL